MTAYVLLFVKKLKKSNPPLSDLVCQAETLWTTEAQLSLKASRHFDHWKRQWSLFLDHTGVWRCGGRLHNAQISYATKFPAILPNDHHFTTLVIDRAHKRVFHNGVKETLTEIRSRYWIPRGRAVVRQFIFRCTLCHRFESQAYKAPTPPLPPIRVQTEPPFTYTGVDFAGPLYVKTNDPIPNSDKVWICLYTCCVTRAVHLDLVPNLSTHTFLYSFRRFAARRGLPRRMISDNGKTFKAAAKTLKVIMTDEKVVAQLAERRVEWTFNIKRAPWWGGVFERLVRLTKRCLRKMIGKTKLRHDELLTLLVEVEAIVNSRPLTFVSPNDLEDPLTPSHLLTGCRLLSLPDNRDYEQETDKTFTTNSETLNKRMVLMNRLLQLFWKRWRLEYLLELRTAHVPWGPASSGHKTIAEGDVVIVHDEQEKRGFWKIGLVLELLPGRDGEVWGAVIGVYSGGKCKLLRRPVQRLYPLETSNSDLFGNERSESSVANKRSKDMTDDSVTSSNITTDIEGVHNSKGEIDNEIEMPRELSGSKSTKSTEKSNLSSLESTRQRTSRAAAREARDRIVAQTMSGI